MVSERRRDGIARRAAERVASMVAPPVGCSPGDALAAVGGVVLAFVALLALIFVWSGICHAVSFVWPRLSPALRRVVLRIFWVAVFWLVGRYWSALVAPLHLDETVSVLGLLAAFVLGLRQIILLVTDVVALLEHAPESLIRVRTESPGASPPLRSLARTSQARPEAQAGPTCWICGGVNDGHRH